MSSDTDPTQEAPQTQTETQAQAAPSLLDQAIQATKRTEPDETRNLLDNLMQSVMEGTVTWDKSVSRTFKQALDLIDQKLSRQLNAVMHHEKFQKLEGSWRGLHYLVHNSNTNDMLRIRVCNITKRELFKDLDTAVEFDQSQIFKKIYTAEYDTPGGTPYGALIGDYEFTNHPEDMDLLRGIAGVAAAGFTPFLSAASCNLFEFDDWTELAKPRDLSSTFRSVKYTKWKSFREIEDSRFVTLAMPRVLARLPYGATTKPVEEFHYEEAPIDAQGVARAASHKDYCWMNAAFVLGTRLTDAFDRYGWCTAIRGAESGGRVENLPTHIFTSDDGDPDMKCPTEVGITDRREKELSDLGFLPLCHYKNQDYAVFFGAQTTQKPKKYDTAEATANAAISARLPYMMATSRFAHYLKVMARDKIGSFAEREDIEKWLNRWINNYVNSNPNATQEQRSKYPLREARIVVQEVPGAPGSYKAQAFMRPWLQFEELTAALSMVAELPNQV